MLDPHQVLVPLLLIAEVHVEFDDFRVLLIDRHLQVLHVLLHQAHLLGEEVGGRADLRQLILLIGEGVPPGEGVCVLLRRLDNPLESKEGLVVQGVAGWVAEGAGTLMESCGWVDCGCWGQGTRGQRVVWDLIGVRLMVDG